MNDETTVIATETETDDSVQKYIDTINEMKKNTVPRAELDKYRDENKRLLESIVNGTAAVEEDRVEATPSIQDLRNKLFGAGCEDLSDIEYVGALLDLREKLIEETGIDYSVPRGKQYTPDTNDFSAAQRVADGLRHCLEIANGDDEIFAREVARITNDVGVPIKNKKQKRR